MQDNFSRGNPVVRENAAIMNANLAGGPLAFHGNVDRRLRRQISLTRPQPMRADQDVLDCGKYRREQQID
jgi:hypothetical protein